MFIFYSALFLVLLCVPNSMNASTFSDNFNDNDITDWEDRCFAANWYASGGMVHGSTNNSPSILVPLEGYNCFNSTVTVEASGAHAFGVVSRLSDEDSGIIAYVSPDNNLARIRLVQNGQLGESLSSLSASFPAGEDYTLSLNCVDDQLTFSISIPSIDQSWEFSATDPNPISGLSGLLMGDESNASWDWIEIDGTGSVNPEITWMITDDQSLGNGNFALEPGETIDLDIQITNNSDESLYNAFAVLQSLNSELTVIQDYAPYGTLAPGEASYASEDLMVLAPLVTPSDEVYPMRLTLMADGGYQEQLLLSLPVGNGFNTDVESGGDDCSWEALEGGWANDWHISSERNNTTAGQYSFKCGENGPGDYSDHHFGSLTTPLINVPLHSEVGFWMWIDTEILDLPAALDGGLVQYGRCGQWIDLLPVTGYTHEIATGTGGPFPDGSPVFSGTVPWTQYNIIVPDELAGPGQIRFVFGSDDTGSREGWYLDDICIEVPSSIEETQNQGLVTTASLSVSLNPFVSSVTFAYQLPVFGNSTLEIYDISGRLISSHEVSSETNTYSWNGRNTSGEQIPSGVYLAKLCGYDLTTIKLIKL